MPKVRSVFLSDIHLGTRACQADRLLDFLREYQAEQTYLIGDIIDFWAMSRSIYWTPAQNTVVQKLLRRARHGERVVFIPGNHDEALRDYCGIIFGEIEVVDELIHETADGRRFLLIHGDVRSGDAPSSLGRGARRQGLYDLAGPAQSLAVLGAAQVGISGYWSLAGYAKRKVKTALNFIFDFEDSAIHHARERGLDGVICGHIHWATIREIDGLSYVNCGDWVDSCTAIVEHFDGRLELVEWGMRQTLPVLATPIIEPEHAEA
jgi:UDP-2,3-diacylglucosamine pyrophosphatase LpxH